MKIGAVTLAYNDESIIGGTINCLKPFVDRHVVLISQKPYFGEADEPDGTEDICDDLDVEVVKGTWSLDHYQRSLGNKILKDCDWIITFDSDEVMTEQQLKRFISFLENCDADVVVNRPEVYWKTIDYVLRPVPDYAPVIAVRPHVEFTYIRNVDKPFVFYDEPMHHLSWCAPKDIYKKVKKYAHAPDHNWEKWYWDHYDKWEEGDVMFPDGSIYNTIKKPLPGELRKYYDKYISCVS